MVELSEFVGDNPLRTNIEKKRVKVLEHLEKATAAFQKKEVPLKAEIAMYEKMLAAIDEHESVPPVSQMLAPVDGQGDPGMGIVGVNGLEQMLCDDETEAQSVRRL